MLNSDDHVGFVVFSFGFGVRLFLFFFFFKNMQAFSICIIERNLKSGEKVSTLRKQAGVSTPF